MAFRGSVEAGLIPTWSVLIFSKSDDDSSVDVSRYLLNLCFWVSSSVESKVRLVSTTRLLFFLGFGFNM